MVAVIFGKQRGAIFTAAAQPCFFNGVLSCFIPALRNRPDSLEKGIQG
jgi:hypothetical protein